MRSRDSQSVGRSAMVDDQAARGQDEAVEHFPIGHSPLGETRHSDVAMRSTVPRNCRSRILSADREGPVRSAANCGMEFGIELRVLLRHYRSKEAPLERFPHATAVECGKPRDGGDGFVSGVDDEASNAVVDDLSYRTIVPRDDRRSTGHRLDHDQTEGLGPVDGKEERRGLAEELILLLVIHFSNELDAGTAEQWFDDVLEIGAVNGVDFRCDFERHFCSPCDFDRAVQPLFR